MLGAAALNLTGTHPRTDDRAHPRDRPDHRWHATIRSRSQVGWAIERMAWSPDDAALIISPYRVDPLTLTVEPPFEVDTRSANIQLYRLNLVTGTIREPAWRADVYGVSSMAVPIATSSQRSWS